MKKNKKKTTKMRTVIHLSSFVKQHAVFYAACVWLLYAR